ncbi:MAG: hypothetical protein WBM97_04185 [Sedimenticolaceae bacterium]
MNTTFTVTKIRRALMLCAGFAFTSFSWAVDFPASFAAPQIQSTSNVDEIQAELYEYFHDAELHKPDGLGNYSENYRLAEAADPQILPASTVDAVPPGLPAGLYEYFHDAELHKLDGLGNYAQNFQFGYPN